MPPCLIFIDGLDVVAKKRENAQKDMEVRKKKAQQFFFSRCDLECTYVVHISKPSC